MPTFKHDPQAVLDYLWDWAAWLNGDTISSHSVSVPTGITLASSAHTDTTVKAWLSGGTAGLDYKVTSHITTVAGRQDERTILIRAAER